MKTTTYIIALLLIIFLGVENVFAQQQLVQGQRMPRLTTQQRDQIPVNDNVCAGGLFIYNIDSDCIEYWNGSKWISLCGDKSEVEVDCEDVTYYGRYIETTSLNPSNYLAIDVNVIKVGEYTITATTSNGYGFYSSGTFLNTGFQQITLAGQGRPVSASAGDTVRFVINNSTAKYTCTSIPVTIPVEPAEPSFTMDCNTVTVNGVYFKGTSLKPTNTITLAVNVVVLGTGRWSVETNTVDGIYFRGSGIFTSSGIQTITLHGYGKPTTAEPKHLTIFNSKASMSKTCTATVNCTYTTKTILVMGNSAAFGGPGNNGLGYSANSRASYNMIMAAINFGTNPDSRVQVAKLNMSGLNSSGSVTLPGGVSSNPTTAQLKTALANKPDIVIIGWGMSYSNESIAEFIDYLNNGGVMIILNKYTNSGNANNAEAPFFSALFGTTVTANIITNINGTTLGGASTAGSVLPLVSIPGDPVLDGPFGDLNGLAWGNDYFPAVYMSGIPESQIITYSGANVVGSTASKGVTMFRHADLNLFWVGDGGFLANERESTVVTNNNIQPFNIDASYRPVPKVNYGTNTNNGGTNKTIYNSQLFANVMAWAIKQAESNGINAE
ncbi:MAG: hypothetical protein LBP96_03205 [Bacteroidales bacterium]|jgi:hypothetical protein|nr:hypothetical protein [Bacteroidales bacterium]